MNRQIPYDQTVFIAYRDKEMTLEAMRLYPTDEQSYYRCMDQMIENYSYYKVADRRKIDLSPYERFQLKKYGNTLGKSRDEEVYEIEELTRQWIEYQLDDHLGY